MSKTGNESLVIFIRPKEVTACYRLPVLINQ